MYNKTIHLEKEISKDRLKKIVKAIESISGWYINTDLINSENKIILSSDSENRLNDLIEFWNTIEK